MTLDQLKKDFQKGTLSKQNYIDKMHEIHTHMFEYAEFIKNTDIAKIQIVDDSVVMTSRTNGIQLIVDKDDKRIIPIEILNFDHYEKENSVMILNLIDDGNRIFDIGGNIGWYSLTIAKNKKTEVFTFEPIPKTFTYLTKNIALNKLDNIRTFNFGFSNKEEELSFYYYPEGSGNASLANLSEQKNVEVITCRVNKFDDFIKSNNLSVDFIKCDVEGAELFVFQGGLVSIQKYKPIVFSELLRKWAAKFNYHPNEVISLFKNLGYRCFVVSNGKLEEFFAMDDQTIETNFFFLHNEQHREKINKYAE
jgi:FkbM family methyltransferase